MNQTIRSRIEQIKRGEIPEGYEKTPFGIFPCDWEKSTLKKLGEFAKGKGIPGEKMKNEGIPCVGYGDIYMKYNYHFNQAKSFIDRTTADESIQVGIDTLLFTGTGETAEEIGKCVCYTGSDDIYVGGDIIIFNSVDVSPVFIAYQQYLPFAIKQKAGFGQGHSVVHIYKSDLEKLYCAYPKSKAEQEKIAEILQEQDRLIELKEKLIEEKKKQKQYLMEVLLTGKVRLPGFTDEWITDKLKNHIRVLNGFAFQSSSYEREGKFKVITIKNVKENSFNTEDCDKISVLPEGIQTHQLLKIGDILMSLTGNVGRVCIVNEKDCLLNQRVAKVVCLNQNETGWIVQLLNRKHFVIEMQNCSSGAAQANLSVGSIYDYAFVSPKNKDEKIAIADILIKADDELDLLQKELEEQKRKKQFLMQLLLTGIVRVKA